MSLATTYLYLYLYIIIFSNDVTTMRYIIMKLMKNERACYKYTQDRQLYEMVEWCIVNPHRRIN